MANTEGMQHKFRVIKEDDVNNYLSEKERFALNHLQAVIALGRESDGKPNTNEYLVVNTDESYAGQIIHILKQNGHWGKTNEGTDVEQLMKRQMAYYLDENNIKLSEKENQQVTDRMLKITNAWNGWDFSAAEFAEVFSQNMDETIREIKDENTDTHEIPHAEMVQKVDDYINFNGMGFSTSQRIKLLEYLDNFRDDKDAFESEMICEIRTMNGD